MTSYYSKNITPDGITGMILALEGIKSTIVLLNGPMGCKFYHSTTSQYLAIRPPLYLPSSDGSEKIPVNYNFLNNWFFRQARVPCTYLDGHDYVYGTAEKVKEGLEYLKEHVDFELLAIVNSPGASLIGDNLKELVQTVLPDKRYMMLESPGFSEDFCTGYESAFVEWIRQIGGSLWKNNTKRNCGASGRKKVNLLGVSIWQRYWDGDIRELKRLLELCQIEVNCCPFADASPEEMEKLPDADLNVVLYPEMAIHGAELLKEQYGMPYYICPSLPVGFSATEEVFSDICEILGTDVSAMLEESEKARALAWFHLDSIHQMCGMPNGALYAVEGSISQVYAYGRFLSEYLGMIPDCLSVTEGNDPVLTEKIAALQNEYQKEGQQKKEIRETCAELVFAEANTIAALKTRNIPFCGIEISRPGMGYVDLLPKTQMGLQGSLFLIEQVLNGLMSKI